MAVFYILVCVGVNKLDLSPFNTDGNVQLKLNVQPQEPKTIFFITIVHITEISIKSRQRLKYCILGLDF